MVKKILLLFFVLTVNITGLLSCVGGTCHKFIEPPTQCVTTTDISIQALNETNLVPLSTSDSIKYHELIIDVQTLNDERSCYKPQAPIFGNAAYACSKITNYLVEDSIRTIVVVSDSDFDKDHKAGIDLMEYFTAPDVNAFNRVQTWDGYRLNLTASPGTNRVHKFTVQLTLASGAVLEASTIPVTIL